MSMADFHCETLEMTFRIQPEGFNKELFLNEVTPEGKERDETKTAFSWSYGSRVKPPKHHAHISVYFLEKHVRIELSYHNSDAEIPDVRPPYVEDCAQWLSQFFNDEIAFADVSAFYVFGEGYAPAINLPFPLVSPVEALSGALVAGMSLEFPKQAPLDGAFIQRAEKSTLISAFAKAELDLKGFDLNAQLQQLSNLVTPLVKTPEKQS